MRPLPKRPRRIPRLLLVENDDKRYNWFKVSVESRLPQARLNWCKTSGTALANISKDLPTLYAGILLDHDLDRPDLPYGKNGLAVAKRIAEAWSSVREDVPILVHSANITGGPAMHDLLVGAGFKRVTRIMFPDLTVELFKRWLDDVAAYEQELAQDEEE